MTVVTQVVRTRGGLVRACVRVWLVRYSKTVLLYEMIL